MWVGDRPRLRPPEAPSGAASRPSETAAIQRGAGMGARLHASTWAMGLSAAAQAERQRDAEPTRSRHAHHTHELDGVRDASDDESSELDPRMLTLARMIEALTGMQVRTIRPSDLRANGSNMDTDLPVSGTTTQPDNLANGWGLEYERHETITETQSLTFSAGGEVHTADGQTIQFKLELSLTSTYTEETFFSLRAGDAVMKDPLVLNFEGPVGALADTRFTFDLDADGTADQMPFVGQGSGFLVLDRNQNGAVDDGRELFGALSGDGFADLARYDDDHNGWIDAADAVFSRLQVWRLNDQGQPTLSSLASTGAGALHLGRVDTPYALRDAQQKLQGQMRASSIYLTESGQVKALQQIDLLA